MTSNPDPPSSTASPSHRGWGWLAIAIAWVAIARIPLALNARSHLDSDLAVDGLTLIDALKGHWRWHYPATPFIGAPPVLLSYVQARIFGPSPMALVSGGVVAYGLVVVAAYLLNRRAFGPSAAAWGLIPMAFASTGTIWLSGRVTGGHLLAAAWHAGAFALLWGVLAKGGWRRSAAMGLWCGLGLWIDSMFAVTWVGLGVGTLCSLLNRSPLPAARDPLRAPLDPRPTAHGPRPTARDPLPTARDPLPATHCPRPTARDPLPTAHCLLPAACCLLVFALASGLGLAPRIIGRRVDPHDAYVGQFEPVLQGDHILQNGRILVLDCLPRLIAGHRLPGLQAEPDPVRLEGKTTTQARPARRGRIPWARLAVAVVSLGMFGWAMVALAVGGPTPLDPPRVAIRIGLLASTMAVVAGFLVHPSITNSDNYRYLVVLLVPWSSGFGLMMARLASKGGVRSCGALAIGLGFAVMMTVDTAQWYARLGWVDSACWPIRKEVDDPALDWLDDRLKVSAIVGDYWDVYKLSFLTGGRVKAIPFPQYPDRFPEFRRDFDRFRNPVLIVRPSPLGAMYRAQAMARGVREDRRGAGTSIVEWPEGMTP